MCIMNQAAAGQFLRRLGKCWGYTGKTHKRFYIICKQQTNTILSNVESDVDVKQK